MAEGSAGNRCKGVAVRPLVLDIQRLLRLVPDWKLRVIKRSANAAADWVAIQTKLGMCLFDWIRHHPSSLVEILDKDGLPTPP